MVPSPTKSLEVFLMTFFLFYYISHILLWDNIISFSLFKPSTISPSSFLRCGVDLLNSHHQHHLHPSRSIRSVLPQVCGFSPQHPQEAQFPHLTQSRAALPLLFHVRNFLGAGSLLEHKEVSSFLILKDILLLLTVLPRFQPISLLPSSTIILKRSVFIWCPFYFSLSSESRSPFRTRRLTSSLLSVSPPWWSPPWPAALNWSFQNTINGDFNWSSCHRKQYAISFKSLK